MILGVRSVFFQDLYKQYGLSVSGRFQVGNFEAIAANRGLFLMIPADQLSKKMIEEWKRMGSHLQYRGEPNIACVYLSNRQQLIETIGGKKVVLLQCYFAAHRQQGSVLEQLARFHQRGKGFQEAEKIGYQPWNKRWEARENQLEHWVKDNLVNKEKKTAFDTACLQSFSYFQGLAENAIQYFVDSQIEEGWIQSNELAVAHHRFHEKSWLFVPEVNQHLKLPFQWTIDHPMRDLAEYVRPMFSFNQSFEAGMRLIQQYAGHTQLTSKDYRLLFSRLLFPIDYVETIEGYYSSNDEYHKQWYEKRMMELLQKADEREHFLGELQHQFSKTSSLPKIEWLSKQAAI
jgi:spore coat protein YutH